MLKSTCICPKVPHRIPVKDLHISHVKPLPGLPSTVYNMDFPSNFTINASEIVIVHCGLEYNKRE